MHSKFLETRLGRKGTYEFKSAAYLVIELVFAGHFHAQESFHIIGVNVDRDIAFRPGALPGRDTGRSPHLGRTGIRPGVQC